MTKEHVHVNIPVAHFRSVLSWDKQTIDSLVDKAIDLAVKVGLRLEQDVDGKYLQEAQSKGAAPTGTPTPPCSCAGRSRTPSR